jgi:hypothetical protein
MIKESAIILSPPTETHPRHLKVETWHWTSDYSPFL